MGVLTDFDVAPGESAAGRPGRRAPHAAHRRLMALLAAALGALAGCSDSTAPPGGGNETEVVLAHMNLRIVLGETPRGEVFDVAVFDEATRVRVAEGSTRPDATFCSTELLDVSRTYRLEVYELPARQCILVQSDGLSPPLPPTANLWGWSTSCSTLPRVEFGTSRRPPPRSDCWGP